MSYKAPTHIYSIVMAGALGSLVFGYIIGVLNTSWDYIAFVNDWKPESTEEALYKSLANGVVPGGAALGAVLAGSFSATFGRRGSFMIIDLLTIAGSVPAIIPGGTTLILGRLIGGICVGLNSAVVPLYISEIAPTEIRGTAGTFHQLFICAGVFISFMLGFGIPAKTGGTYTDKDNHWWQVMIAVPILLAALRFIIYFMFIRWETPTFLAKQGNHEGARDALSNIYLPEGIEEQMSALQETKGSIISSEGKKSVMAELFSYQNRKPLIVGCMLMVIQQFSGINAVMFYSNEMFKGKEGDESTATIYTSIVGLINFGACFITGALVDKSGRRKILFVGCIMMIMSLTLLTVFNLTELKDPSRFCILLYVLSFAVSWGPVPWLMVGELLTEYGASMATLCNWICCIIVVYTLPFFTKSEIKITGAFIVYNIFCLLGLFYLLAFVPETKGKTKAEIKRLFYSEEEAALNDGRI